MMKKIFLFILLLPLLAVACIEDEDDKKSSESKVAVGDLVPSFTVKSLSGGNVSSNVLDGKVGLIVFFDTTCKDCQRELPKADSLYLHYKDNPDFVLLPIARAQSVDEVSAFWYKEYPTLKLPYSMPAYVENSPRETYNLFAEKLVPRFYLVGKNGKVSWIGAEKIEESVADFRRMIDKLLLDLSVLNNLSMCQFANMPMPYST